nr:hypothetical protein [Pseudoduganella lutea]
MVKWWSIPAFRLYERSSAAAADAGHIEKIVDQTHYVAELPLHNGRGAAPAPPYRSQQRHARPDGVQGIVQLMRQRRQEFILVTVRVEKPGRLMAQHVRWRVAFNEIRRLPGNAIEQAHIAFRGTVPTSPVRGDHAGEAQASCQQRLRLAAFAPALRNSFRSSLPAIEALDSKSGTTTRSPSSSARPQVVA